MLLGEVQEYQDQILNLNLNQNQNYSRDHQNRLLIQIVRRGLDVCVRLRLGLGCLVVERAFAWVYLHGVVQADPVEVPAIQEMMRMMDLAGVVQGADEAVALEMVYQLTEFVVEVEGDEVERPDEAVGEPGLQIKRHPKCAPRRNR